MKNIIKITFASLLVAVGLLSCEKDEHKIFYENGTPPVLTASSTTAMLLDSTKKNEVAVSFNWTNPDYQFTTGISSQDVTYILQIDTTADFTNPNRQEVSIPKDLAIKYTVKDLNTVLTKLNIAENIPHNIGFRVKANLANNSVPLYSNIIKITITPYLDVAIPLPPTGELYVTGTAVPSGYDNNPPASQKFTAVSKTEFTITLPLTPGKEYKFLSTLTKWQPQYGGSGADGGDLKFNLGLPGQSDPPAIPTPAIAASYKITANFKTGKYTVQKQ